NLALKKMNPPIVVGLPGASGAIYAVRLLEVLRSAGREVHLSISPSGRDVIRQELNLDVDLDRFVESALAPRSASKGKSQDYQGGLHYYHYQDFMAPMASGSFL